MPELNKKILVVEDESPLRRALHDKLQLEGYTVLEALNGEEGLEIALREHPDLILLDVIMPKMDGLTMLKKLRENDWGKKVKIILLTSISDDVEVAHEVKKGAYDSLVKSDTKMKEVVDRIRERLNE
jgi:DNA-binding response OmpR family regulator